MSTSSFYVVARGRSLLVLDANGNRVQLKSGDRVDTTGWSEKQIAKSRKHGFIIRYDVGIDPSEPAKPVIDPAPKTMTSLGPEGNLIEVPVKDVENIAADDPADAGQGADGAPDAAPSGDGPFNLDPAGLQGKNLDELRAMIVERDARIDPADVPDAPSAIALLSSSFQASPSAIAVKK